VAVTLMMEQMAIAVLRGDEAAALALADELSLRRSGQERQIPPVTQVSVATDRLRVACRTYPELGGDVVVQTVEIQNAIRRWLFGGEPLVLVGMSVELYELPEPAYDANGEAIEEDIARLDSEPTAEEESPPPTNPDDHSPLANDSYLDADAECRRIWRLLPGARKRNEVAYVRRHGAIYGGCCERFADRMACDCMQVAQLDSF
jgi:hypothetical protein